MNKKYICDDRDVLENLNKIRNMTDDEFEKYIKSLREDEKNENPKN